MESHFRIGFWLIFAGMIILQLYFAAWTRLARTNVVIDKKVTGYEGWQLVAFRTIRAIALIAFLLIYTINPSWLEVLSVPFPNWLRWVGVTLGIISLALYAWSRTSLGEEWSSQIQIHQQHHLVTSGPYAWMRHPIYLAMTIYLISISLVSANWFLIAFLVVSILDLALRIPKEEQMMIEAFGDEYKDYMRRTGRMFPHIHLLK
jgi:protein-S-isoprenylcysteine O-methyltransferase Ste14